MRDQDVWKIADFGLTAQINSETLAYTELGRGTRIYRAPEVARAPGPFNEKVDVWAIGVIFYEVLFREQPKFSDRYELDPTFNFEKHPIGEDNFNFATKIIPQMLNLNPNIRPTAKNLSDVFDDQNETIGQPDHSNRSPNPVLRNPEPPSCFPGDHAKKVHSIQVNSPNTHIATVILQDDSKVNLLQLWDARSKTLLYTIEEAFRPVLSPSFSPDGNYVAFHTGDHVTTFDVRAGYVEVNKVHLHSIWDFGEPAAFALSPRAARVALVARKIATPEPRLRSKKAVKQQVDLVLPQEIVVEKECRIEYNRDEKLLFYTSVIITLHGQISFHLQSFNLESSWGLCNRYTQESHIPKLNVGLDIKASWHVFNGIEGDCIAAEVDYIPIQFRNKLQHKKRLLFIASQNSVDNTEIRESHRITTSDCKLRFIDLEAGTIDAMQSLSSKICIAKFNPKEALPASTIQTLRLLRVDERQMTLLINKELRSISISKTAPYNSLGASQSTVHHLFTEKISGSKINETVSLTAISTTGNRIAVVTTERHIRRFTRKIRVYTTNPVALHWTAEFQKKALVNCFFKSKFPEDIGIHHGLGMLPHFARIDISDEYVALSDDTDGRGRLMVFNIQEGDNDCGGRWVGDEIHDEVISLLKFIEDGKKLLVLFAANPYKVSFYLINTFSENYQRTNKPSRGYPDSRSQLICPWDVVYNPMGFAISTSVIAIYTTSDRDSKAIIALLRKAGSTWTYWGHEVVQVWQPDNYEERGEAKGITGISLYKRFET